ncbi:transposase [Microchaete diplosiphon NIES-3275]|nr:transposase [Microchaete diplosiphon NIES-3275]
MKNWNAYDAALKQRGSITFWVNEEIIEQWRNQQKTGRKGSSNYYSDVVIAKMGTIQSVFHLSGRQAAIPPRSNAKIQQHPDWQAQLHPRDENLRRVNQVGLKQWKQETGYHRRSLSETAIFRLKIINGCKLRRRYA